MKLIQEEDSINREYKLFLQAQWLAIELNKHKPPIPKGDAYRIWEKICRGCAEASGSGIETQRHFLQICNTGQDNWT